MKRASKKAMKEQHKWLLWCRAYIQPPVRPFSAGYVPHECRKWEEHVMALDNFIEKLENDHGL